MGKKTIGFRLSPQTIRAIKKYKEIARERASPGEIITSSSIVDKILWHHLKDLIEEDEKYKNGEGAMDE